MKPIKLTKCEAEVVHHMIYTNSSNIGIAAAMSIKEDSVKKYLSNIFSKFDVYSRTDLVIKVLLLEIDSLKAQLAKVHHGTMAKIPLSRTVTELEVP